MDSLEICAVLTGDVVASQQLNAEELDHVRSVLGRACGQIELWASGLAPYKVEFSRGDAWQFLLMDPSFSLRAALFIRAELLFRCDVDTRVAVGIGQADALTDTLALSGGVAFVRSGQLLDSMGSARVSIGLSPDSLLSSWIALAARLCDALASSWTRRQAELISMALHPSKVTQAAIAASLSPPISKQAVGKGLRSAQWDALSLALAEFERAAWSNVCNP